MRRQLAQAQPNNTAASIWTPAIAAPYLIDLVNICNTTTGDVAVSLFHDTDGTTFTEATALVWQHTLKTGEILCYAPDNGISGYEAAGNLGAKCDVTDGATFTVYGEIEGEQL